MSSGNSYTFRRRMVGTAKRSVQELLDKAWSLRSESMHSRIIYYHSIHPSLEHSHRPADFDCQMKWLKDRGYRSVQVSEIPALIREGRLERWVAVTLDDGYSDNLEYAAPILQSYGFSATVFVVAGMVAEGASIGSGEGHKLYSDRPMLTRGDLKDLVDAGIEIGSHGYRHLLASHVARESPPALLEDLSKSRQVLAAMTGTNITSYAYPNGQRGAFSTLTRRLLDEAGFEVAATTMWGALDASVDTLQLPRCEVVATDTLEEFAAKMTGRREYRRLYQNVFDRSRAW